MPFLGAGRNTKELVVFSHQNGTDYICGFEFSSHNSKMQVKNIYIVLSILTFLPSKNLGPLSVVLILAINLLSSYLKCHSLTVNVFAFTSEIPVNGKGLHWIQPQCADAYDKRISANHMLSNFRL